MATKEKMRRVLVHVDERCIRLGQKKSEYFLRIENCPIARALRASGIKARGTGRSNVYFKGGATAFGCLPVKAQRALIRFDTGKPQGPLKFNITVPERFVTRKARA